MLRFLEFITEAIGNKEFNLSDSKGKLFEILAGSHLKHGSDKNGEPADFLSHYRDEDGNSPRNIHNYIKEEMEKRHPGMYSEINDHAREAAEHLRNNFKKDGHHTLHDIAWTSQPSDHKSFTGLEDPNSDADIMVRTNRGHVGVSLKYGSQKEPNLRNPGLASIETLAGTKKGEIVNMYNEHQNKVRDIGYTKTSAENHRIYKANKNTPEAKAAEESSLQTRRKIAQKWQNGYAKMSSDQLKDKILSLASPETVFPHYRLHTRTGLSSGVEHHMAGVTKELEDGLSHYAEFKAVPHNGEGITAQILGRHHNTNTWHPVIDHGVKGTSGPMKGMNGTTKLKLRPPKQEKQTVSAKEASHGGSNFYSPSEI
jgi:hypothetical protein